MGQIAAWSLVAGVVGELVASAFRWKKAVVAVALCLAYVVLVASAFAHEAGRGGTFSWDLLGRVPAAVVGAALGLGAPFLAGLATTVKAGTWLLQRMCR